MTCGRHLLHVHTRRTALAGHAANILLAYVGMVVWKLMYYWAPVNDATIYIAMFLQYLVLMNVSLAVCNLIPVPPLDGSRILLVLLPRRIYFGVVRGRQRQRTVFALPKLTIPDDKVLLLEIIEKNGARHQTVEIAAKELLEAKLL